MTSGMAGSSWAYEFAGRRGRNRAAGKASFLHPGLVFLRFYCGTAASERSTKNALCTAPPITGGAEWASISRRWPAAGRRRATSFLRPPERNVAFGAKNIGVEIGNPLPADVEI